MIKSNIEQNSIQEIAEIARLINNFEMDYASREHAIKRLTEIALRLASTEHKTDQQAEQSRTDLEIEYSVMPRTRDESEKAIDQLNNERRNLNQFIEAAGAGTWKWDVKNDVEWVDSRTLLMLGYTPDDFNGDNPLNLDDITDPTDKKRSDELLKMIINDPSVDNYICELWMKCKDGTKKCFEDKGKVVDRDENGLALYVAGTTIDITERKLMQEEIIELSLTDELTGLGNRRYLKNELERFKKSGRKNPITVISWDVADFKTINDTLGHDVGDRVLRLIADILKRELRSDDCIVRMGGDEFIALLPLTDEQTARNIQQRIEESLAKESDILPLRISAGIATSYDKDENLNELLTLADIKMYEHKKAQKNGGVIIKS